MGLDAFVETIFVPSVCPAGEANSSKNWDQIWSDPNQEKWRGVVLDAVYKRIIELIPPQSGVVMDIGGGTGALAKELLAKCREAHVVDHSEEACHLAARRGLVAHQVVLDAMPLGPKLDIKPQYVVSTEVLEHLTPQARSSVYAFASSQAESAMFSVPHDRLGPEDEAQHTRKFTALEFLMELREWWGELARVEVIGGFLLGVVGQLAWKPFRMSMCLPVRDEEKDLGRTLASFRAVADEIVVGIDPRTKDATEGVARKYAEKVFYLTDMEGPEDERVPEGGVNFAWVRNQCIAKCSGDWIFMTEGHERLGEGVDVLLQLDQVVPDKARVAFVLRTGEDQQWGFPWLFRNHSDLRFTRAVHNILSYPDGTYVVMLPQVRTIHERHEGRTEQRAKQRKVTNRVTLMDDWLNTHNEVSLLYLGAEWREHNQDKAIERFEEFLSLPGGQGAMRYHTRLLLSKCYYRQDRVKEAKRTLLGAVADDWSRTEHWLYLGDIAFAQEAYEEALQWYLYPASRIGDPPFTMWWIDLRCYKYLPAQRLAMTYGELGKFDEALHWAERVCDLLPIDSPEEALAEAHSNVQIIKEAIDAAASS